MGAIKSKELVVEVTAIPYESITSACAAGASVRAAATAARGRMVLMRCFVFIVVLFCFVLFSRLSRMAARSLGMVWVQGDGKG